MMRNLYCFIALLFLSFSAVAQSVDTVRTDTSKRVIVLDSEVMDKHEEPLIIIDGTVYKGKISQIDPNNIAEINVVRDTAFIKMYGKQGANGIIFITTKGHRNIYNQKNSIGGISNLPDSAIYVIDGVLSDKKLGGVNPLDILSIDIIKKDKASEYFEGGARNGVVLVITKAFAIKSYQKKLSAFSKKYKNYIETHQNSDDNLVYILNGTPLEKKNNDEIARTLYKISIENIKTVKYADNFIEGVKSGATIFITTKNK